MSEVYGYLLKRKPYYISIFKILWFVNAMFNKLHFASKKPI